MNISQEMTILQCCWLGGKFKVHIIAVWCGTSFTHHLHLIWTGVTVPYGWSFTAAFCHVWTNGWMATSDIVGCWNAQRQSAMSALVNCLEVLPLNVNQSSRVGNYPKRASSPCFSSSFLPVLWISKSDVSQRAVGMLQLKSSDSLCLWNYLMPQEFCETPASRRPARAVCYG